uniref:Aldo_ket_red domain-containing protein n=1 Tax=Caenorhabditis tropicalis TaxID=1561998 RepID=A0A1I7UVJ3_9PELO
MSDSLVNALGGSYKLNSGYHIPLIGFGTYKVTGENVQPAIDAALTAGYRLFDTAKYYLNEKELGEAFKVLLPKHKLTRADIFLTTKFFPESKDSREVCRGFVEESLKNLQTDYIDMYLVHYPKPNDAENDDAQNPEYRKIAYEVLEEAQAAGKIRSVGVSNYEIVHLDELKTYAKIPPCANQLEYHPHFARIPLKKYCNENGIFFQAFSSLARHEPKLIEDPTVVELAKKHNTSVPLVLLAWALRQNVGIVPKSVTPARIIDNFKVKNVELSQEDIQSLTALDRGQHYIRCTGWLVK